MLYNKAQLYHCVEDMKIVRCHHLLSKFLTAKPNICPVLSCNLLTFSTSATTNLETCLTKPPKYGHDLYREVWKRSIENPNEFWAEQAENLTWNKKWDCVMDNSNPPFTKW